MGGAALGPPLSHAPTAPRDDGEPPQVPESRYRADTEQIQTALTVGWVVCVLCVSYGEGWAAAGPGGLGLVDDF